MNLFAKKNQIQKQKFIIILHLFFCKGSKTMFTVWKKFDKLFTNGENYINKFKLKRVSFLLAEMKS